MISLVSGTPWPPAPFVVDLDALDTVDLGALEALESRRTPTVGVVRGDCTGQKLAAAVALDVLVAGTDARFGRPAGWTEIVVRRGVGIVGAKVIAYLAMTHRLIGAERAHEWGLVSIVDPDPSERAHELIERIMARSPVAVSAILCQAHLGAGADYAAAAPRLRSAGSAANAR